MSSALLAAAALLVLTLVLAVRLDTSVGSRGRSGHRRPTAAPTGAGRSGPAR